MGYNVFLPLLNKQNSENYQGLFLKEIFMTMKQFRKISTQKHKIILLKYYKISM